MEWLLQLQKCMKYLLRLMMFWTVLSVWAGNRACILEFTFLYASMQCHKVWSFRVSLSSQL